MFEPYRKLSGRMPQYVNKVLDLTSNVPWPVVDFEEPQNYGEAIKLTLRYSIDSTIPLSQNAPEIILPLFLLGHERWSPALWMQRLKCVIPGWYVSNRSLLNLQRPISSMPSNLRYTFVQSAVEGVARDASRLFAKEENGLHAGRVPVEDMAIEDKWSLLRPYPQLCRLALLLHKAEDCPRVTKVEAVIREKRAEIESWSKEDV